MMTTGKPTAYREHLIGRRITTRLALKLPIVARTSAKRVTLIVRNLSSSGFLAETERLAEDIGSTLVCDLPNDVRAEATVIWADDGLIGAKFFEPLAQSTFSAALLKAEREAKESVFEGEELKYARLSGQLVERSAVTVDKLPSNTRLVLYISSCLFAWTLLLGATWLFLQ